MSKFRFWLYTILGLCVITFGEDRSSIDKAIQAVVIEPATSCDWWINVADFYRSSDDKGHVVLVGAKNVCTVGPDVESKTVKDNEIEFVTGPMGYDTEVFGYIVTDREDRYVAHVKMKKRLKTGEVIKFRVRFAKVAVPESILTAKFRCVDMEKKPVERYYVK